MWWPPCGAGFGLKRLPLGERQVVRLARSDLQVGRSRISLLAAVRRVGRPVGRVGFEARRRNVGRLAHPQDAGGGGGARGSAERPGDFARSARNRRIHDAARLERNPQQRHVPGHEVRGREAPDERRGGRRIPHGVDFDVDLGGPVRRPRESLLPGLGKPHLRTARGLDQLIDDELSGLPDDHMERRDDAAHRFALNAHDELRRRRVTAGCAGERQAGHPRAEGPATERGGRRWGGGGETARIGVEAKASSTPQYAKSHGHHKTARGNAFRRCATLSQRLPPMSGSRVAVRGSPSGLRGISRGATLARSVQFRFARPYAHTPGDAP